MKDFFEGVGQDDTAGIWEGVPGDYSAHRAKEARRRARAKQVEAKKDPASC